MARGFKTGGGSRLGKPNKAPGIRPMIMEAFNKAGGVDYLLTQAHENPVAFMNLLSKLLPTEISAELKHSGGVKNITKIEIIPVQPIQPQLEQDNIQALPNTIDNSTQPLDITDYKVIGK